MPGIIANALNNGQTAYGADTEKVDASLQTVDQPTQTVAGQLHSILASDSPTIQQARSGALDTANSRGLINSSIAAGAGESAAIGAALPIASQDASTYTQAAQSNQAAKNAAATFNAGATNTSNLNAANAGNTSELSTQQTEQQKSLIGTQTEASKELAKQGGEIQTGLIGTQTTAQKELAAQSAQIQSTLLSQSGAQAKDLATLTGQIQTQLQQLKGDQATTLTQIDDQYKALIQASSSAAGTFQTSMGIIGNILADVNTSTEQKQSAVDKQLQLLKSSLTITGSAANIDLGGLLDFDQPT